MREERKIRGKKRPKKCVDCRLVLQIRNDGDEIYDRISDMITGSPLLVSLEGAAFI